MYSVVFDVGSGACKAALVYRASPSAAAVPELLYASEKTVLLAHGYQDHLRRTGEHLLPPALVTLLWSAITEHLTAARAAWVAHTTATATKTSTLSDSPSSSKAVKLEPLLGREEEVERRWQLVPRFGICTAVFRNAHNGAPLMKDLAVRCGLRLQLVTQRLEGLLGYRTAQCLLRQQQQKQNSKGAPVDRVQFQPAPPAAAPAPRLVVWDSGGASFQLTYDAAAAPTGSASDTTFAQSAVVWEGPWGSSSALYAVVKDVQKRPVVNASTLTANPMSATDVEEAVALFRASLRQCLAITPFVRSNQGKTALVGIGGPTSAFSMCRLLLGRNSPIGANELREQLLLRIVGRDDATIGVHFPQPEMVGPKVSLVIAVLEELFGADSSNSDSTSSSSSASMMMTFLPSIGNTLGIANSADLLGFGNHHLTNSSL